MDRIRWIVGCNGGVIFAIGLSMRLIPWGTYSISLILCLLGAFITVLCFWPSKGLLR